MVLIMTAILYLVAATLLLLTMTEVHLSDFELRSTQALYAAESSVTLGVSRLRREPHYRSTTSDTFMVGNNPAMMTVDFQRNLFHNTTSLYHLTLKGTGVVPGWHASTARKIKQDVIVKPFALFAQNSVFISQNCHVIGDVHANGPVILESGSKVTGNVTSAALVQDQDDQTIVSGKTSFPEPNLTVPELDLLTYYPKYWYQGTQYEAQPLNHDTILLSQEGPNPAPFEKIEVYSGYWLAPDNPAGVFYLNEPLEGPIMALDLEGTLIIPPDFADAAFAFTGPASITPVDNFPAIVSAKPIDITFMDGADLRQYSNSIPTTHLQGLVYGESNILIRGNGTTGRVMTGSLVGTTITLETDLMLRIKYDNALLESPPPGIDFLELGAWQEAFAE
jgi:hypothetical protein